MEGILPGTLTAPCKAVQERERTFILPGFIETKNEIELKTDYEFIAKPLQLSSCNYALSKSVEDGSNSNSEEEKDTVRTFITAEGDEDIITPTEFGFGIAEEVVENELCDDSIIIDKMAYTNSVENADTLSFCSILDQIPEGNDLVDGNVNIELYLECSDDNENNSNEQITRLKPNNNIAEATSQIKMDTQFKVSFPLIPERGLKCSLCKLVFLSKDFLREHTILKHNTDFFFCNLCPYFTKSNKFFNTHVQTRHLQSRVSDVGRLSALKNETKIVVTVTDKETGKGRGVIAPDFKISSISEPERSVKKSEKHLSENNCKSSKITKTIQEYDVTCEQCDFMTKSYRLLNYHKQTMHNKKREIFHCSECEYTCLQRRSFESHCRRHTGVFEFQCKICNKKFVSKHLLTKHSRTHIYVENSVEKINNMLSVNDDTEITNRKRFCNTSTQTKLVKNDFIHGKNTDNRNVYTKKCVSDLNMKRCDTSYAKIPNRKKFECTFNGCDKVFRDSYNLRNHLAVHTKSKSIKCAFCMFTCIQINSLNHHINSKHS